jgi:cobyric acid synthase
MNVWLPQASYSRDNFEGLYLQSSDMVMTESLLLVDICKVIVRSGFQVRPFFWSVSVDNMALESFVDPEWALIFSMHWTATKKEVFRMTLK